MVGAFLLLLLFLYHCCFDVRGNEAFCLDLSCMQGSLLELMLLTDFLLIRFYAAATVC